MRVWALPAAAVLVVGVTPARAQDPAKVEAEFVLGEPKVDARTGVEYRLPRPLIPLEGPPDPSRIASWELKYNGGDGGLVTLLVLPEHVTTEMDFRAVRDQYVATGYTVTTEQRVPDPVLRTAACLRVEIGSYRAQTHRYYFERNGVTYCLACSYDQVTERLWTRMLAPMLLTFRATRVPDTRLLPPVDGETREVAGLTLLTEKKGAAKLQAEPVGRDLAAGFVLARELTGGPALAIPPRIHLHSGPATLQLVVPGKDKETPTALYVPEGRTIIAHGATTTRPGKGSGDRYRAALLAYLDARLGTAHGLWPWIRTGLCEAALAATPDGATLVPAIKTSSVADWLKKHGAKAEWPDPGKFVHLRDAVFDERGRAYALALVLAAHRSADAVTQGMLPRYFARMDERLDPDAALEHALEGVDLAALDAAAKALLRG